jgi:hypothetical protein
MGMDLDRFIPFHFIYALSSLWDQPGDGLVRLAI